MDEQVPALCTGRQHMIPARQSETDELIERSRERDRQLNKSCIYDDIDKGIVISLQIASSKRE